MSLSVPTNPLCPEFTVCGQISLTDVAVLARKGFRSIINNRPDGEGGPDQPTSAQIEAQAKAHGMHYVHFPVSNLMISEAQVAAYQQQCAELPHPIVGFCRSGGRASALFQACGGQVGKAG
ncbi:MAG: TIGR01244 family phosphatase [Aquabacterium sp.]|uniref:TIGR01244 family sulfur transferase n=1 Tax=Aquabacterium sp. TaxID=1872578 RepID=UPI0025BA7C1D|nr:TIGR01244 family sulfur transferase [Aquabacterium sp.]MBI5924130.1 TIGR01244 family phosphatase [Aquabacterium sp.]